ncbi:hypothetical protein SRHO_G00111580 [Serrasalmus rhombeus]
MEPSHVRSCRTGACLKRRLNTGAAWSRLTKMLSGTETGKDVMNLDPEMLFSFISTLPLSSSLPSFVTPLLLFNMALSSLAKPNRVIAQPPRLRHFCLSNE